MPFSPGATTPPSCQSGGRDGSVGNQWASHWSVALYSLCPLAEALVSFSCSKSHMMTCLTIYHPNSPHWAWRQVSEAGCRMTAPSVPSLTLTFFPKDLCTQTKQPLQSKRSKTQNPSTSRKITKLCQLMQTDTNTWGGGEVGELVVVCKLLPRVNKSQEYWGFLV